MTQQSQFNKLVEIMEQNPEIARGTPVFGGNKDQILKFWEDAAMSLNSLGLPNRVALDWRKVIYDGLTKCVELIISFESKQVWTDLKRNLKKKIAENKKEVSCTGGGPFRQIPLSALEERIDALVNISASAAPTGVCFGIDITECERCEPSTSVAREEIPASIEIDVVNENMADNVLERSSAGTTSRRRKISSSDNEAKRIQLLEQQTEQQKSFVSLLKSIEKAATDIKYSLRKIHKEKELKNNLLKKQIKEAGERDMEHLKLKKMKLELKRRSLELKTRQLEAEDKTL